MGSFFSLLDVTIGFEQTVYTVQEDDGSREVCVSLREGTLQTSVTVSVNTVDGSATGEFVFDKRFDSTIYSLIPFFST